MPRGKSLPVDIFDMAQMPPYLLDMEQFTLRGAFLFLLSVFTLGFNTPSVQAQIDSLDPVWVKHWKGLSAVGNVPCNAWDVHVYGDTVYTTGVKTDNAALRIGPMVLNAYTLSGDTVWEREWEGLTGIDGTGASGTVLLGHQGELYLGGMVPVDSMMASLLQKWDLNGNLIWSHNWGDHPTGHHEVNGLAVVDSFLYVSHYSAVSVLDPIDAHIKKFNLDQLNAGMSWSQALIWDVEYGMQGMQTTTDGHIYADQSGVYVVGQADGPPGIHPYHHGDSYLMKFDPQGDTSWVQYYTGNGSGCDNAFNLKSDGTHLYVLGFTTTHVGVIFPVDLETQVFVQKYTMGGTLLWTELFGGPKTEYARGLEVDEDHVYAAVSTKSYVDTVAGGEDNTLLLTIDKNTGNLISQRIWGGLGTDNANNSIDQDAFGSIYLSGYSTTWPHGVDSLKRAVVLKVDKSDLTTSVGPPIDLGPVGSTVYPNPISSDFTIQMDRMLKDATVMVHNQQGQLVHASTQVSGSVITFSGMALSSGLYLITVLQDGAIISTSKLIAP